MRAVRLQTGASVDQKQPSWLRGLEILLGFLTTILAAFVLVLPGLGIATLIILLYVGLLLVGIRSIIFVGLSKFSRSLRAIGVATGIISLILAAIVAAFPGAAVLLLIVLLTLGLLSYGVGRISLAYSLKASYKRVRVLVAIAGVVDIILSSVVLVFPGLAVLTFAFILGLVLFVNGAEMLVSGVGGRWIVQSGLKQERLPSGQS
jgi:uncharacterized membrane protein HdeD (DUF308 family)